jgi:hypothetical protein
VFQILSGVTDEMSDEEDGRVMDEPGGDREPHKDVPTVSLETLGPSSGKKNWER